MFPKEQHFPFDRDTRIKDMDGVYQSIESGHVHVVKNVYLRSFISADGKEAYRNYTCSLKSTDPEIGNHKRIVLEDVPWEFLLPL